MAKRCRIFLIMQFLILKNNKGKEVRENGKERNAI